MESIGDSRIGSRSSHRTMILGGIPGKFGVDTVINQE